MDIDPSKKVNTDPFGPEDPIEKLADVAQRAIAEGEQIGDKLLISIPVDESMSYWGTGIWHFTDDGRMGRANDLFSENLCTITGQNISVHGFGYRINEDSGDRECILMATVTDLTDS